MSLIVASKALRLCKGSAVAPSKRAKNLTASRTRLSKIGTPKISSRLAAWPSGILQPSFTSSNIQHTHTTAKWSTIRTYATQPSAQNDDAIEEHGWSEAKSVVDQLKTFSVASKKKIGDWLEANEVTLDTLATYADPDEVSRKEHLPRGPFGALVKKVKEIRAPKPVSPPEFENSEFDRVQWVYRPELIPALQEITNWADRFKNGINSPRQVGYISISGGSGTGKTRMAYELGRQASERLQEAGYSTKFLAIRYAHDPLTASVIESKLEPKTGRPKQHLGDEFTALRWLHSCLFAAYYREPPSMESTSTEPKLHQQMEELLLAIRSAEHVPRDQPLVLLFNMDEYQNNVALFSHLIRALSQSVTQVRDRNLWSQNQVFIIPILSGTWTSIPLDLGTNYRTHRVVLAGLEELKDARLLFDQFWAALHPQQPTAPFLDHPNHSNMLTMLGFIPRMIEEYCGYAIRNPKLVQGNFKTLYTAVMRRLEKAYDMSKKLARMDPFEQKHLLVLWFFKLPVTMDYQLNGKSIQERQASSHFFLREIDQGEYLVFLPLIYVVFMHDALAAASFISPYNQGGETSLPQFVIDIHQTTYALLPYIIDVQAHFQSEGKPFQLPKPFKGSAIARKAPDGWWTTLDTLYAGSAEGRKALLNEEILIQSPLVVKNTLTEQQAEEEAKKMGVIFHTPPRFPGADIIAPHAAEQIKGTQQELDSNKIPRLSAASIYTELHKKTLGRRVLTIITPKEVTRLFFLQPENTPVLALTENEIKRHLHERHPHANATALDKLYHAAVEEQLAYDVVKQHLTRSSSSTVTNLDEADCTALIYLPQPNLLVITGVENLTLFGRDLLHHTSPLLQLDAQSKHNPL